MSSDENAVVMTVSEVAEFLRLAESTVYKLAQEGKLPGRKIGGMWRFSRKEVESLVSQSQQEQLDAAGKPPASEAEVPRQD